MRSVTGKRLNFRNYHSVPEPHQIQFPNNTHIQFFLKSGGRDRVYDYQRALYQINDVVFVRFAKGFSTFVLFDPEEMTWLVDQLL